jgi:hypothetical protein
VLSGVLALLYAVFPEWLYGWAMDRRFLVPAGALLLLSLEPRLTRHGGWLAMAVMLGLLARPLALGASFARASRIIAEQVELFRSLPRHARVFPLVSENAPGVPYYDRAGLRHIGHYATLEREAILPTLFVGGSAYLSTWVPLRWRTLPPVGEVPPHQVLVQDVPWNMVFLNDYVYAYGVRSSYDRLLRSRCRVLGGRGLGVLFGPCAIQGTLASPPSASPPGAAAPGMLSREGRSGPER